MHRKDARAGHLFLYAYKLRYPVCMNIKLYNTYAKKEEEFTPIKKGKVSMYTCGPTVYGRPHIGNYSSFLMADLLRRWLQFGLGYEVTHVKNITDVGHLVADADEGEDKVEKQAREEHGEVTHDSVIAIARKYEKVYLEDEEALNMIEPEHRPRATEFVEQMKTMVEELLKKGNAYLTPTEDGIYFDVHSKTPTPYGDLSGNTLENLEAGSRVKVDEQKRHPADFALWKFCVGKNENHALQWDSPKGANGEEYPKGFPGWHIECSAMSRSLLGDQIDIHTGGEDNIFPHHECEIAQSESVTGKKPFVKYWIHRRRIDMGKKFFLFFEKKKKMSKSLGNVLTISDITEMGYSPLDLRYYFLSVHYRTQLKFTEKGLDDARKARRKIVEWMEEVRTLTSSQVHTLEYQNVTTCERDNVRTKSKEINSFRGTFIAAMNSDLNTPEALAVVFDCMAWSRTEDALNTCNEFVTLARNTFGCFEPEASEPIPGPVQSLLDQRAQAREGKDFSKSDQLRDEIRDLGYEVRDLPDGQRAEKL